VGIAWDEGSLGPQVGGLGGREDFGIEIGDRGGRDESWRKKWYV
jgi:hypothetical protein